VANETARREAGAALVEALDVLSAALPRAVQMARTEERAAERAAVVAWLRAEAYLTLNCATPSDVADAIERGEHRREQGP
jgi:S-methylmethionine-dependent homocysteine/selenocysteine methylase